jgi:hypothetical protein
MPLSTLDPANSVERIFPCLGETGTTADIAELLEKTR